jgi:hypothetical protein
MRQDEGKRELSDDLNAPLSESRNYIHRAQVEQEQRKSSSCREVAEHDLFNSFADPDETPGAV